MNAATRARLNENLRTSSVGQRAGRDGQVGRPATCGAGEFDGAVVDEPVGHRQRGGADTVGAFDVKNGTNPGGQVGDGACAPRQEHSVID